MKLIRWITVIAVLALTLGGAVVASAQDGDTPPAREVTDDEVNAIASQLFCPVCENVPLDVCPTQACADWRDEIRAMLEQGRSEAEIKAYFVERYGQRVLATPEVRGINLIVWIVPPVAVLGGVIVLIAVLRRLAPSALSSPPRPASKALARMRYDNLDAEYVAQLERDLEEFAS